MPGQSDHVRLRVISEIHDGVTRELLRRDGFSGGSRFVGFGCGLGYVTRWAAAEGAHATVPDVNEKQMWACEELGPCGSITSLRVLSQHHKDWNSL